MIARAPAEIAGIARRLGIILRALRAAAPSAAIVVLAAFHASASPTPEIDALYNALNAAIADVAAITRADIADARSTFNSPGDAARTAARTPCCAPPTELTVTRLMPGTLRSQTRLPLRRDPQRRRASTHSKSGAGEGQHTTGAMLTGRVWAGSRC